MSYTKGMESKPNARFAKLAPRHKDCLRLVYNRKKSGQIATLLNISVGTVNGYCNEAVRIIGARDRVDAAEQFVEYESDTPLEVRGHFEGVAANVPELSTEPAGAAVPWWHHLLPIRTKGTLDNELGFVARMLWIPIIAFICAIGFGVLADTLQFASEFVAGRALR